MGLATAIIGSAVVGAVASNKASSKAVDASNRQADAALKAQEEALDQQVAQADRVLEFNKEQYRDGKERQVGVDAINKQVVEQNLRICESAEKRANESYDLYRTNGRPLVEKTLKEASDFDSQGNIDAARGRATADVAQASANAERQNQNALQRLGINPSSGRFMALQQRLQADKTAMLAGAATNAEDGRRNGGIQLRQQASNLAQGFPAQSIAQNGQASSTGQVAANTAGNGQQQNLAITQQALNGMQLGAGIYGSVAQGYGNIYGQSSANAANIRQAGASAQQGWGNLAGYGLNMLGAGGGSAFTAYDPGGYGMGSGYGTSLPTAGGMANGGKVEGPGTGTSDSVPAVNKDTGQRINLSNGEFVISADVVKKKGVEFFEKLQEKYHTPVNLGRNQ